MKTLKDAILSHINETINVSVSEAIDLADDIVSQHEAYELETMDWQVTQDACLEYVEIMEDDAIFADDWY